MLDLVICRFSLLIKWTGVCDQQLLSCDWVTLHHKQRVCYLIENNHPSDLIDVNTGSDAFRVFVLFYVNISVTF